MSGVYIKGMEMPNKKNGAVLIIYPDGKCAFEGGKTYQAVPVPDHGDLIDRDASLHNLGRIVLPDDLAYTIGHDIAKRFFENAPTIIPADKEEDDDQ